MPIALEAVVNGKYVMVTKPLADSEEAARELVEAAEAAGVVNMMSLSTAPRADRARDDGGAAQERGDGTRGAAGPEGPMTERHFEATVSKLRSKAVLLIPFDPNIDQVVLCWRDLVSVRR